MGKKEIMGGAGITASRDVSIGDNTDQIAIGEYINQFKIEKPSGKELFKLIYLLDQKRKEEVNKEILNKYTPSELPYYPPQLKEFVTHNRADEITKALTYLQDHHILLISGIGGVGKTTLVRALIETRPSNVPLPFWFDFGKKMDATLGDVLERFAGYMNAPGIAGFGAEKRDAGQDDINKLTGELLRRERLWLVFDNLESILDDRYFHDEGLDKLFTSLRDSTHNAKIIITSRVLPALKSGDSLIRDEVGEEKHDIRGLKTDLAVDFLVKNGFDGVDRKNLEKLAKDVDGHPLALRLLIPLVKKFGVKDTLSDLSRYKAHKEDTIKKAKRLFDKLAGDEKELLERLSVFRKPEIVSIFSFTVTINQPIQTINIVLPFIESTVIVHDAIKIMSTDRTSNDAVEKLMDKSLLETDYKGNYWLHPLIREFSYDDLKNKIEIHKLACQYYLTIVSEKPAKEDAVQSLIEAHYHACMAKEYDTAASIIFDKNLHEDLDRQGKYRTLIELYTGVLPKDHLRDDPLLSDKQTHSAVLGNLGNAYKHLGEAEKAIQYYEKALTIAQEIGDKRGEKNALGNLGNAYSDLGQFDKASEYYEKALAIAQEIGDRRGEGIAIGNLGIVYYSLGQLEKTIQYYEKALAIAVEIGDRIGEGNHLGNLGLAYSHLGEMEKAIQYYEKALTIAQEIGYRKGEGSWLGNLGLAYSDLGKVEKAIQYYEKALAIAVEIGDRRTEGNHLNNLGIAFIDKEKYKESLACLLLAKEIRTQIKDPNLKTTESNLQNLKEILGKKEFEKLAAEAALMPHNKSNKC